MKVLAACCLLLLVFPPLEATRAGATTAPTALRPVSLVSIHMVTPLAGWAEDQTRVLHTSDGGRHWLDVTPPSLRLRHMSTGDLSLDVVDGRTAWLAGPATFGSTMPSTAYVFHTGDAGRTWRRFPRIRLGPFEGLTQLQFVDATHGWMVVVRSVGMSQLSFDILRTRDGALHWARILREGPLYPNARGSLSGGLPWCDCGQSYTYSTPQVGWVGGCYCGLGTNPVLFFRSNDGGRFWRPIPLHLPARGEAAAVGGPVFFSPRVAVLPVYLIAPSSGASFDAYHTSDGGRTWFGTTPIKVQAHDEPGGFVDPWHGFLLDGRRLLRTVDGGRHWQARPSVLRRDDVSQLAFVTPAVGFTLESVGGSSRTSLFESTDAGRTWRDVRALAAPGR